MVGRTIHRCARAMRTERPYVGMKGPKMDINVVLERIRATVAEYRAEHARLTDYGQASEVTVPVDRLDELADQLADVDTWLSSGGFLPDAWQANRVTP